MELVEYLGTPYGRVFAYAALGLAQICMGDARMASRVLHGALLPARDHRVGLQHESVLLAGPRVRDTAAAARSRARGFVATRRCTWRGSAARAARVDDGPGARLILLQAKAAPRWRKSRPTSVLALGASHGLTSYAAIARYHPRLSPSFLGDQRQRPQRAWRARAEFEAMGAVGWVRRTTAA
ncbi:MAG: hypothetical protein U0842_12465 [Candidatus Binatia bacterium]